LTFSFSKITLADYDITNILIAQVRIDNGQPRCMIRTTQANVDHVLFMIA